MENLMPFTEDDYLMNFNNPEYYSGEFQSFGMVSTPSSLFPADYMNPNDLTSYRIDESVPAKTTPQEAKKTTAPKKKRSMRRNHNIKKFPWWSCVNEIKQNIIDKLAKGNATLNELCDSCTPSNEWKEIANYQKWLRSRIKKWSEVAQTEQRPVVYYLAELGPTAHDHVEKLRKHFESVGVTTLPELQGKFPKMSPEALADGLEKLDLLNPTDTNIYATSLDYLNAKYLSPEQTRAGITFVEENDEIFPSIAEVNIKNVLDQRKSRVPGAGLGIFAKLSLPMGFRFRLNGVVEPISTSKERSDSTYTFSDGLYQLNCGQAKKTLVTEMNDAGPYFQNFEVVEAKVNQVLYLQSTKLVFSSNELYNCYGAGEGMYWDFTPKYEEYPPAQKLQDFNSLEARCREQRKNEALSDIIRDVFQNNIELPASPDQAIPDLSFSHSSPNSPQEASVSHASAETNQSSSSESISLHGSPMLEIQEASGSPVLDIESAPQSPLPNVPSSPVRPEKRSAEEPEEPPKRLRLRLEEKKSFDLFEFIQAAYERITPVKMQAFRRRSNEFVAILYSQVSLQELSQCNDSDKLLALAIASLYFAKQKASTTAPFSGGWLQSTHLEQQLADITPLLDNGHPSAVSTEPILSGFRTAIEEAQKNEATTDTFLEFVSQHYTFIISILKNGVECDSNLTEVIRLNITSAEEARELCGNETRIRILSLWDELEVYHYECGNTQAYDLF